jgi:hypothetical protein
MLRELITRFNSSLSGKMVAPRRPAQAPIKIWFDPDQDTEQAHELARSSCILGETADISRTGVGFIVPAIRLKEKYLVGQERALNAEIDLPTGKVYMRLVGRRYEKVGIHISIERFMVGAQITELTGANKEAYETFLKYGNRRHRTAASPARVAAK